MKFKSTLWPKSSLFIASVLVHDSNMEGETYRMFEILYFILLTC